MDIGILLALQEFRNGAGITTATGYSFPSGHTMNGGSPN